jgi:adenylate cyclase
MSGQLLSGIKRPAFYAAILVISLAASLFLLAGGIISNWDKALYDACINHRVYNYQRTKNPLLAAIDLSDTSIEELGETLDTRRAFADLLEVLDDSNCAVVMDFLFSSKKSGDRELVRAVKSSSNAVIAALAVEKGMVNKPFKALDENEINALSKHLWRIKILEKGNVPQAGSFLLPFADLTQAVGQIGFINMEPDVDGIYRKAGLLYEWEGAYIPSLSLAAAVGFLGVSVESIELKAGEYLLLPLSENAVIRIPVDDKARMLIPYTTAWAGDEGRIPFHAVAKAKYDDDAFDKMFTGLSGRVALIAEVSTSQKDFGPTSFEKLYPLSGIHAEAISAMLDGLEKRAFLGWVSPLYKTIILLLLFNMAFLYVNTRRDAVFHSGFFLMLLIFSGITLYRWGSYAITPWFAFPVSLLFFLWLSAFLYRLFARYRENLLLQNALSRYFPHALAQRIMRERKTELVPAYKELTILFSDISGFTKWSSDKDPEHVHNFLNDYLESMAEILFAHGGTVDKFMGDGILSFFGDPLEMPDHCERCLRAAIAMQEKVRVLAVKWKPVVDIDLKVRIGINTGKVIVGNLGNKTRIEYTVIGAAVNLAQRMETNAPVGGILVTADTREKVKEKFAFSEKRDVTVKGYGEAIEAYVVDMGSIK